jgi:two-component system response regulator QseB
VALLDLCLPDGSGLEVLRDIRARSAGTFVAILTAFDAPRVKRACLAAGADAFLSKTTGLGDLPALLASVVECAVRT